MRKNAYLLIIGLFLLVTFSLQRSWRVGEASLPPLGEFFSPFTGFWQNADPRVPIPDKDLSLPGLTGPGEVIWDDRGVPHIFARSYRDALFLQGYAHASDRLWQMDFSTRAAAGRLSEVLGPIALEFDKDKRRRGMLDAAVRTEQAWRQHQGSFALLEAYCAGVNAYISSLSSHQYPIEYKLLQYAPEPWTPLKTALFFKNMALVLCGRNHDLGLTNARALLGDTVFQVLYPETIPGESPIIPQETVWPQSDDTPIPTGISPGIKGMLFGDGLRDTVPERSGLGSNNWAVAPFKTQNGHAILCNDPHLQLTLPSIWYECHIVCPETSSYGATFPGAPGVIIGFNDSIAWGFTNTGIDVMDWYLMDWIDEDRTKYRLGEEIVEVQYRVDTIRVKGGEPCLDTVKITRYGTVYSEDPTSPYTGMACHWIATEVPGSDEIGTFMGINLSHDMQAYQESISGFASPAQNMVYADKSGNISLTVQGRIPLKNDQQGRFFLDGSQEGGSWQGYVPESHRPKVINPDRGYVSSANQRPTSDEFPYYYNSGDFRPYRGTIVNRKLDTMSGITPEKMKALQLDNESLHAASLLPSLSGSVKKDQLSREEAALLDTLDSWDFTYLRDQKIPILFDMWRDTFMEMALDEFNVEGTSMTIKYPDDWIIANLMETDSTHPIWDIGRTPVREDVRDVSLSSFRKACAAYLELQKAPNGMDWGRYKATRLTHLARIDAFSTGTLYTSGAAEALNATKKNEGPSWRMVVELGPVTRAWGVYPGGQSGNPGNPQYTQMVEDWQEGRYYRLRMDKTPGELKDIQTRHWKINP